MTSTPARVRTFVPRRGDGTIRLGDRQIFLTPAVGTSEDGSLTAYSASFGAGERAELPAPYEEVWVVIAGTLRIESGGHTLTAGAGDFIHVPADSPGEVLATEDATLVCVGGNSALGGA